MWLHIDDQDYKVAAAGVAVSDQPQGPFSYHGSFRPHGKEELRDFTLFKVLTKPQEDPDATDQLQHWFKARTEAA